MLFLCMILGAVTAFGIYAFVYAGKHAGGNNERRNDDEED